MDATCSTNNSILLPFTSIVMRVVSIATSLPVNVEPVRSTTVTALLPAVCASKVATTQTRTATQTIHFLISRSCDEESGPRLLVERQRYTAIVVVRPAVCYRTRLTNY